MTSDPPSQFSEPAGTAFGRSTHDCLVPDQAWLHAQVERFERPLITYAARLVNGDWHRARDCVQDTFLLLCRQPRNAIEDHVEAWLFKCCRHRALDFQRKESRMLVQFSNEPAQKAPSPHSDPSHPIVAGEEKVELQQLISALPIREQEVLSLRLQQGLSYKQISEVMELSVSHVGVLLHQAVTHLRQVLPSARKHQ